MALGRSHRIVLFVSAALVLGACDAYNRLPLAKNQSVVIPDTDLGLEARLNKPAYACAREHVDDVQLIPDAQGRVALWLGEQLYTPTQPLTARLSRQGLGGLDEGVAEPMQTYAVYIVAAPELAMVLSRLGPDVGPVGFASWTYLGSVLSSWQPSGEIGLVPCVKDGDQVTFENLTYAYRTSGPNLTTHPIPLNVPLGVSHVYVELAVSGTFFTAPAVLRSRESVQHNALEVSGPAFVSGCDVCFEDDAWYAKTAWLTLFPGDHLELRLALTHPAYFPEAQTRLRILGWIEHSAQWR